MRILYEDGALIAVEKEAGVSSQSPGLPEELSAYRAARGEDSYIGVVHRLDREVSGVTVYAKTKDAAASLSRQIAERRVEKEYLATVSGTPAAELGEYRDLLYHDRTKNKTYTVRRPRAGVKEAILTYETVARPDPAHTTVRVRLVTGRTHQIRVQFASRGTPLVGDRKYGGERGALALRCVRMAFSHPTTGERVEIVSE